MANDSDTYPEGLKSFANMIYVVDPSKVSVSELSGATTYGGEWYYLHADGKYDTTAGSTYEVKDVTAVITTKNVSVYPGKTAKINVKYSNTTPETTKVWSSSNTSVATVDKNGVVKGVKAGRAVISLTVQNPGDA
ncbi:Ig-like domain-containing protein, partial [Streptococcus anginosus]|uniref:Ig-like domain-containing protein n=1 Tax=Streptococcus anginosus TaxID=1328 RepID=UPI00300FB55F